MSQQDDDNTIHCVCVVIRAHMLDAAQEAVVPHPDFDVFRDQYSSPRNNRNKTVRSIPPAQAHAVYNRYLIQFNIAPAKVSAL